MYPLEMINTKQVPERQIDILIFFWHIIPHHFIMNFFHHEIELLRKIIFEEILYLLLTSNFFSVAFCFLWNSHKGSTGSEYYVYII